MVKILGHKFVPLSRLRLPGDLRDLVADPKLKGLAQGFSDVGQINPVLIRKSDGRFICGRKRAAAAIRLGLKRLWVTWVDCDDNECELLTISENLHRAETGEPAALAAQYVEKLAHKITSDDPRPPRWPNGKPTTARVAAREMVAEQRGIQPESVRRYEHKDRQARGLPPRKRGRPPHGEVAPRPVLKTLGVDPDEEFIAKVAEVANAIERATGMLTRARTVLASVESPLPRTSNQQLIQELESTLAKVKSLKPAALCPWCKSLEALVEQCEGCGGVGWLGKGQLNGVPPELLDEEEVKVWVGGVALPAEEFIEEDEPFVGFG